MSAGAAARPPQTAAARVAAVLPHTGGATPEQHDSGEAAYAHYGQLTSASAEDDGPLIQHAGRAMYSSQRIFKSLVGESDFDRMMLIQ